MISMLVATCRDERRPMPWSTGKALCGDPETYRFKGSIL